jgi:hypothetical protein
VFNSLPAPILLDIAIFFTALSWGIGLYIVDRKANRRKMLLAYPTIWAVYIAFHVMLSSLLRYDSLIPPWNLHS